MEGGWCPLRTWTTARWKYIQSTKPELYDLQADPHETNNVIDLQPNEAAQLSQELADFDSTLIVNQGTNAVLSEQEQRALASLGYTGGQQVADQQGDISRRDIKETLKYAEQVHQCMHLIDRNELEQARQILEGVVEALPDYPKAWGTLGVCFAKQEDYPVAEQHFRQALALDANQNFARIGLGRALFAQNHLEECVEQLETAVNIEPSALDAQYFLGEACRKLRRWKASRNAFDTATTIAPGFIQAQIGLADLALDEGKLDEAAARYGRMMQRNPSETSASLGLGRSLTQMGREANAVQVFEELLHRSPDHVEALMELARLLVSTRNPSIRDPARSVGLAELACELTNRREAAPLRSLAAAYAGDGRLDLAIQAAESAVEIARQSNSASLVAEIERELSEFLARREKQ